MKKDKKEKANVSSIETGHTRREMLRLVGAAIAAGSVGISTIAQHAEAQTARGAAPNRASDVIKKIINDPKVLNQVEAAKTATERRQVLARAGFTRKLKPEEVQAAVMQILATHSRPGGKVTRHVIGMNDWETSGGTERVVEWVAAIAILVVA